MNNNDISIRGAIIADITVGTSKTTEVIYLCDKVRGFFLSKTALEKLNIIHENFPQPIEISKVDTTSSSESPTADCGCPLRSPCPPIPDAIPFPATPEYTGQIESWIKEHFSSSAFNTCKHQKLQVMTGDPLKIEFREDGKPVSVHKPIPVPHHWKESVKSQLDQDVNLGIIEQVPTGTPTDWCSRMITVPKKDGTPRRTVDLQKLNASTKRETHYSQSPFNIVSVIPPHTKKTTLDAWNGYHSVPLADNAKEATTFITEWGRYRYLRAPQGFHGSGDGYTKRFDNITNDFPRVQRCVDDSILWDSDIAAAFWHTMNYIKLCADNGIVFNPDKFRFARDTVEFAGFDVTPLGYKPNEKILEGIKNFPSPTNITGVRSWFGLVNQVSYAFAQAPIMSPFRDLLKHDGKFYWDETLEQLFQESKRKILDSIDEGVRSFEVKRQTCITTDWSKTGIGFTLLQKHCSCPSIKPTCGENHWKTCYAGSRFTSPAESGYAPVEGEALALLFALESCRMFVMGCPNLVIAVDHESLAPIFNKRDLFEIKNPRLLDIREKTLMYQFHVIHIPGIKNVGANFMSRIPLLPSTTTSDNIEAAISASIQLRFNENNTCSLKDISHKASEDLEYRDLYRMIQEGFPINKDKLPQHILPYWKLRNDLYCVDNLIFLDDRVLIPRALRRALLEELHIGHQGVTSMRENAKRRFFWPQMSSQIQNFRNQCARCNHTAPSNRKDAPEVPDPPSYPFQQTVTDLFHMAGRLYIVYADRFSGWPEVASTKPDATASTVNTILRRYFTNFGVPEELSSDGGPPFTSHEFENFLKSWNVSHRVSSVGYAQSNGRAEAAVKTVKRILTTNISQSGSLDTDNVAKALLLYRNTPSPDMGVSPSELLFGRNIRDHLPAPKRFRKEWIELADIRENTFAKRHQQTYGSTQQRQLPSLKVGDTVSIQNQTGNEPLRWEKTGIVSESLPHRQYRVIVDGSRRTTLRNRQFLRPIENDTRNTIIDEDTLQAEKYPPTIKENNPVTISPPETIQNEQKVVQPERQTRSPTPTPPTIPSIRRSTRNRRPPERFKDYVMK